VECENNFHFWGVLQGWKVEEELGDERNGRTRLNLVVASTRFALRRSAIVANQKFFRTPVRFDFLVNGRDNGSPTEVIDYR
jgi:hypothetical protein